MSRLRATKKKSTTKTTKEKNVRNSTISRADYRTLATIWDKYGPGELVRGVAALLEVNEDIVVVDEIHHLSERLHAVGDDLMKLHEVETATGKFYYGSA